MTTIILTNTMVSILSISIILFIIILLYLQYKPDNFDLRSLLLGQNNKPSINKLGQLIALFLSSWGFVFLTLHDKLTETYFGVYMSVWAGANFLNKYITTKPISEESK